MDGERGETGLPDESNIIQPGTSGSRRGVKESEVGRNKDRRGEGIYSLLYADDMVVIVEKEEEMKSMLERLEGYRDKKGLEINIEKTKIVRFDRGRGEEKE